MKVPVVFQYQRALDEFRRGGGGSGPLLKRMSELISLLDFTTTLSSGQTSDEVLGAALLIAMGELGASRGVLLVRDEDGRYALRVSRGLPAGGAVGPLAGPENEGVLRRAEAGQAALFDAYGLELLCPVLKADRPIALIGVGRRADGRPYADEELAFLESVAGCAATPIENGLIHAELRRLNRTLQAKLFELEGLFDISRELTSSFDEGAIRNVVTATVMGHLMVSRCAFFQEAPGGFELAHGRGLRAGDLGARVEAAESRRALGEGRGPRATRELPAGPLRELLERARLALVVPVPLAGRVQGFFGLGERASGAALAEEEVDFAITLGRQALSALESVRLHRVRVQKERQDRELQIAREIQLSLFPKDCPRPPGFELAAESRACYEVGGDYFDFIALPGGRLALVVADVSGKGTPASLLMASVHASLQALAGSAPPAALIGRLNRFLYQNTQANKYVTLFYAELDPGARRLRYVNAGHVPPFRIGRDGSESRLEAGGTVLGLLDEVGYECAELALSPGDLVAMVTDGATEALSPAEVELGDRGVFEALAGVADRPAQGVLEGLFEAVAGWTGPAGCTDDLTALILKAL